MLRIPHFLDNRLTDGREVVSLTRRSHFTAKEDSCYSFLLDDESTPRAILWLRGLGNSKKLNYLIGNRMAIQLYLLNALNFVT
jgi:hypothetical protein